MGSVRTWLDEEVGCGGFGWKVIKTKTKNVDRPYFLLTTEEEAAHTVTLPPLRDGTVLAQQSAPCSLGFFLHAVTSCCNQNRTLSAKNITFLQWSGGAPGCHILWGPDASNSGSDLADPSLALPTHSVLLLPYQMGIN